MFSRFAGGNQSHNEISHNAQSHKFTNRNNTSFSRQLFEYFKQITWEHEYDFLKYYQNIARLYMNLQTGSRGLLVYQTMGMGKSILAIAIAMDQLRERKPIILLTKSLQENMKSAVHKYVRLRREIDPEYHLGRYSADELSQWIETNFSFVSMNASNMLKQVNKAAEGHSTDEFDKALEKKFGEVLKLASLDGKLLIVDEAHNFFRAITNGSKNAIGLYDMIMKAKNLKLVFLTGTPIANDPFETVPCFNMLAGETVLPETYKDFAKLYVDPKTGLIKNKERFQNRLFGMISHVTHHTKPGAGIGTDINVAKIEFPEELPVVIKHVNMDADQYVAYKLARDKEMEEGNRSKGFNASSHIVESPALTKPKSKASSTYRVRSRQFSNFCAPLGFREESDPSKIPEDGLESAKYRAMYEEIQSRPGQLGLVYSQFVGVGGLGTFARYLETKGWKKYVVGGAVGGVIGGAVGDTNDGYGPEIPSLDSLMKNIESNYTGGYDDSDPNSDSDSNWWVNGGNDSTSSNEDISEVFFNENTSEIAEEIVMQSSSDHRYSFHYATESDVSTLTAINPNYVHDPANIQFPKYIAITNLNDKPIGYTSIEYAIKIPTESDPTIVCAGRLVDSHFDSSVTDDHLAREITHKILEDAVKCRDDFQGFKKMIWTGGDDGFLEKTITKNNDATVTIDTSKLRHPVFALISGEVDTLDRKRIEDAFNEIANKNGGIIDLILVSSTGAEGLDLHNGRYILMTEPYFTWGRAMQINSRFVRNDSHLDLPESERNVQMFLYLAVPPESEAVNGVYPLTTDVELYEESIKDQAGIDSFTEALKEISIECLVNGEPNCRVCSPTNTMLFSDDPERDIRSTDPCSAIQETEVEAEEVIYDGETFYFTPSEESIYEYQIFVFDTNVNGYRPLSEADPRYKKIIEAILGR